MVRGAEMMKFHKRARILGRLKELRKRQCISVTVLLPPNLVTKVSRDYVTIIGVCRAEA